MCKLVCWKECAYIGRVACCLVFSLQITLLKLSIEVYRIVPSVLWSVIRAFIMISLQ